MKAVRRLALLACTVASSACFYAPYETVFMVPRPEVELWDGKRAPRSKTVEDISIADHVVLVEVRERPRAFRGALPPYALWISVYAVRSSLDTLLVDSVSVQSSAGRVWDALADHATPVVVPMKPDPLEPPPRVFPCLLPCTRQRAHFVSASVISPDVRADERITVTLHVRMLGRGQTHSGTVVRRFRPKVTQHSYTWLTV